SIWCRPSTWSRRPGQRRGTVKARSRAPAVTIPPGGGRPPCAPGYGQEPPDRPSSRRRALTVIVTSAAACSALFALNVPFCPSPSLSLGPVRAGPERNGPARISAAEPTVMQVVEWAVQPEQYLVLAGGAPGGHDIGARDVEEVGVSTSICLCHAATIQG